MYNSKIKIDNVEFEKECIIIDLKIEYAPNYIGNIDYAIITDLSEDIVLSKYKDIVKDYFPFIVLNDEFRQVKRTYDRNENKFKNRNKKMEQCRVDEINLENRQIYRNYEDILLIKEQLNSAYKQLTKIQQKRFIKYYIIGKKISQISKEEKVSHQNVSKSIRESKKVFEKILLGELFTKTKNLYKRGKENE